MNLLMWVATFQGYLFNEDIHNKKLSSGTIRSPRRCVGEGTRTSLFFPLQKGKNETYIKYILFYLYCKLKLRKFINQTRLLSSKSFLSHQAKNHLLLVK